MSFPPTILTKRRGIPPRALISADFELANSEWLSVASSAAMQGGAKDYAFTAWVKPESLTGDNAVLGKTDAAGNNGYLLDLRSDGSVDWCNYHGGTFDKASLAAAAVATGVWAFLYCEWDNTAGFLRIYVDNGALTSAAGTASTTTTGDFTIGRRPATSALYLDGIVGLVGRWNRLLSATERTEIYNQGAGRVYRKLTTSRKVSLVSYWDLNEFSDGTGPVTRIDSHGANNLTDNATVASVADTPA